MDIIPLFSTKYSLGGRSILTLDLDSKTDKPSKIEDNKLVSIFSIARENKLNTLFVVDTNFSGYIEYKKNAAKFDIDSRFGIKLTVCDNINDKSEESLKTESSVIVWLNTKESYEAGIQLYSLAATDGFYYRPRISWALLKEKWNDKLFTLMIDYYNGFLIKNLLENHNCVPDLGFTKPVITIMNGGLPFDNLLQTEYINFAKTYNYELQQIHNIYYHKKQDYKNYLVARQIAKRSCYTKPNLEHNSSCDFCWEKYVELKNENNNIKI